MAMYIPRRILLQWHITDRCNLRCRHCYQQSYDGDELPLPELLAIHSQLVAMIDAWNAPSTRGKTLSQVTITGGEPFLRHDVFDLMAALVAHPASRRFALLTNGTLIDDATARRLSKLRPSFVQVSIEGTRATHDAIRGQGAYDDGVRGLKRLIDCGVKTLVSFSAHRDNYRDFADVARMAADLGVARVWCDRAIPGTNGGKPTIESLSPLETRDLFERLLEARRAAKRTGGRTEIAMHRALQFLVGGGTPYRCTAGDGLLALLPNGDLLPCRRLPLCAGNVLETSLETLYQHNAVLRSLREHRLPDDCRACLYGNTCSGGLRCLAYAATGDVQGFDPGCWRPGYVA